MKKKSPFEDKVDLFSPLCSKYQWEYACNNTQRITLSASRCNKMHTWFWLSFFCGFTDVYWSDDVFCTWGWILNSHMLQMFFRFFLYVMLIIFTWVDALDVKGFQCVDGPFRVYVSPLTSFFEKRNWEVCFMLILNGQINACRQKSSPFFDQAKTNRQPTFLQFLFVLYRLFFLFHWYLLMHCISSSCMCL